jgi:hypothetical protein
MAIIPSFLGRRTDPSFDDGGAFGNYAMRMGEVQELIWPSDKRNLNKRVIEYRVMVQHRGGGTGVTKMYDHCVLINPIGSLADYMVWTLRADKSAGRKDSVGTGSKVLLLCINGESNNAVIIGGIRDDQDDAEEKGTKDDPGHHLRFAFNGIGVTVDNDGQLTVTYGGATKADGTTDVDDSKIGTSLFLDKDGGARLGDKDAKNSFFVDHANSKVVISRDTAFELGAHTDFMLLGQSFRQAQQQMNAQLQAQLQTLQQLLITAGTAIATTSTAPTPVPGLPQPTLAPAGAALIAAAQIAAQMGQTIQQFEQAAAQKNSFLSKYNSAD